MIEKYSTNTSFIIVYLLIVGINGISVAWTTGGNNQTASIFAAKMDWTGDETRKFNTMINLASQTGKAMGAFFGGRLIPKGRKPMYLVFNLFAIVTCLMMQYLSIYSLVLGKFLNGFSVTVVHISAIKMVNETIPVYMLDSFGTIIPTAMALGYLLVLGFGIGLPSNDYNPDL